MRARAGLTPSTAPAVGGQPASDRTQVGESALVFATRLVADAPGGG